MANKYDADWEKQKELARKLTPVGLMVLKREWSKNFKSIRLL